MSGLVGIMKYKVGGKLCLIHEKKENCIKKVAERVGEFGNVYEK